MKTIKLNIIMSRKIDLYLYIQQHTKQPITSFDAIDTKLNYIKKQTEIKKVDKLNRGTFTLWNKQIKQNKNEITLPFYSLNNLPKLLISNDKDIMSVLFNVGEFMNKTSIFCTVYFTDKTNENFRVKEKSLIEAIEKTVIECNLTVNWYLEQQQPVEQKQKYSTEINSDLLFFQTYTKLNDVDLKVLKSVYDILEEKEIKDKFLETCKAIQSIKQSYVELVN
jgi:hypothetical protein